MTEHTKIPVPKGAAQGVTGLIKMGFWGHEEGMT
jgi:hypothetical protein